MARRWSNSSRRFSGRIYSYKELRLSLASEAFQAGLLAEVGPGAGSRAAVFLRRGAARIPAKDGQPVAATLALLNKQDASIYPLTTEGYTAFLSRTVAQREISAGARSTA